MRTKIAKSVKNLSRSTASFFVPMRERVVVSDQFLGKKSIVAIIPTHKPKMITYRLTKNLSNWYPDMKIFFVDDSTPNTGAHNKLVGKVKQLSRANKNVIYLRTPENKLKAGAINYALDYLTIGLEMKPQVVLTMDDDISFTQSTIPQMVKSLYEEVSLGAVCTIAKVKNKNVNTLTRLQAMEYHNFNITKVSDNGFLKGPLVMPGMLTAYRFAALRDSGGFTVGHLIEDYDLTAKMKVKGWKVGISTTAEAYTEVPENLASLWRQRIRWTLGGLQVVRDFWKSGAAVFQDLLGHLMFVSLLILIGLSFLYGCVECSGNYKLVLFLIIMSVINFLVASAFNILTFLSFKQKDRTDWVLKLTMLPEFIYSNFLTLILMGSYIFYVYKKVVGKVLGEIRLTRKLYKSGLILFSRMGYSYKWGTKGGEI